MKSRRRMSRPRALERALASRGRFGDTELAHVNSREKALLMALGGSGSRNPSTGFPEFFEAGGNDVSMGGPGSGDPASDPGTGPSSPGGNQGGAGIDAIFNGIDLSNPTPGVPGPGSGDPVTDPGTGGTGLGGGGAASPVPQQGWLERNFGILNPQNIARNMDPRTPQGMVNALTAMSPFGAMTRGAISRGTQALGGGIEAGLNAMGIYGSAKAEAPPSFGDGRFEGDRFDGFDMGGGFGGAGSDRDYFGGVVGAAPGTAPVTYPNPDPGGPPEEISSFIGPGMSDLQQRALISTYGTQGTNSSFRADPVKKYYARLLNRALSQDAKPYTLPVENLYWQGVLGKNVANADDASQIRNAIAGYL